MKGMGNRMSYPMWSQSDLHDNALPTSRYPVSACKGILNTHYKLSARYPQGSSTMISGTLFYKAWAQITDLINIRSRSKVTPGDGDANI